MERENNKKSRKDLIHNKFCPNCKTLMEFNDELGFWFCPACGYSEVQKCI